MWLFDFYYDRFGVKLTGEIHEEVEIHNRALDRMVREEHIQSLSFSHSHSFLQNTWSSSSADGLALGSWHGCFKGSPFWNGWSFQDGKCAFFFLLLGFFPLLLLTTIWVLILGFFWEKVKSQNGYLCGIFPGALPTHLLPHQVEIFMTSAMTTPWQYTSRLLLLLKWISVTVAHAYNILCEMHDIWTLWCHLIIWILDVYLFFYTAKTLRLSGSATVEFSIATAVTCGCRLNYLLPQIVEIWWVNIFNWISIFKK